LSFNLSLIIIWSFLFIKSKSNGYISRLGSRIKGSLSRTDKKCWVTKVYKELCLIQSKFLSITLKMCPDSRLMKKTKSFQNRSTAAKWLLREQIRNRQKKPCTWLLKVYYKLLTSAKLEWQLKYSKDAWAKTKLKNYILTRVRSIFCCSGQVRSAIFGLGLGLGLKSPKFFKFFTLGQKKSPQVGSRSTRVGLLFTVGQKYALVLILSYLHLLIVLQ